MNPDGQRQTVAHPISRIDADDSRLLKKEFLRLIRVRTSIIRTLCDSDQAAIELAKAGANREDEGFESDIEGLLWKCVAMRLESGLKRANEAAARANSESRVSASAKTRRSKYDSPKPKRGGQTGNATT